MKTKTKALALFLSAVLLVVTTVFTTMAYLTSQDSVTNTFTFGRVGITLDEAEVDENGVVEAGGDRTVKTDRVDQNVYHLIPGHTYVKDPTIHVDTDSETCWLFVKLENGLKKIIAEVTIESQMLANDWKEIDSANHIWAYCATADKGANVPVFDSFKLTNDANVSEYGEATITVTAYAVQADGFDTALAAWTAASGSFGN